MGGPGTGGGAPSRDLDIPGVPGPPRAAINFCRAAISWSGGKDLSSNGSVERIWRKEGKFKI